MTRKSNIRAGVGLAGVALAFLFREALVWLWDKVLDLIPASWASAVESFAARLPWLNMLALAVLVVGVGLFVRGSRQTKDDSANAKTLGLWTRAEHVTSYITRYRSTQRLFRSDLPSLTPIVVDGMSLMRSFEKAGYAVPDLRFDSAERTAVCLEQYFGILYPLMRDGHIDDARAEASQIAEAAAANAKRLGEGEWWTRSDW